MSATGSRCSIRGGRWPRERRTRFAATSTSRPHTSVRAPSTSRILADGALELTDLEVAYGGVPSVRGLSLAVAPGEIVGLIGPNGAGKSTTLHAIMGLVPARGGDVVFDGTSLRGRTPEAIARSGIALVPEGRRLFAELTVEENLRLGLAARPRSSGAGEDIADVVELFPIVDEFRHRPAGALSGGQQQQLAIAR